MTVQIRTYSIDKPVDITVDLASCIIGIYHEKTVQTQNFSTGGVVKARR